MFRNLLLFVTIFGIHLCVNSQQKELIKTLIDQVENETKKVDRLILLDSLSKQISKLQSIDPIFYKNNYPKYELKYIAQARELDSFDLAAYRTSKLTYYYLSEAGKPDSSLVIINNIIGDSIKLNRRFNLGSLYLKRAGTYFQIDKLRKAINDYERSEKIFHQNGDSIYEADAIFFCGQAYERSGELTQAILKYQKANNLYAKLGDTSYMAYTKINTSSIFSQLYLLDESFKIREEVRALLDSQKNRDYAALSELSVKDSRDFVKKKEFAKQETALLNALELSKKQTEFPNQNFRVRAYLSAFYSKHNQLEKAKKYLDTIALNKDLVNSPFDKMFYLKALGDIKFAEKKYKEAKPIFEERINIFKNSNDIRGQVNIEKGLYEINKKLNDHPQALVHLDRHLLLKDSIYNLTRSNSVIYYQTLYETEKRDSKIAIQNANIIALENKNLARKRLLIFGGIGLSLFFISLYLYRNRILLMRNKRMQQSFLQELLQTQERVSKRISKDLHDSVGQSLLLVKNRVLQNNDEKTSKVVDGVIDEVRAISRSLHPFKLEELGLTVTLQSSVEMIDENYDMFISAEIDNIDEVFDQEKEINIYRLVQESFNNILKHSNARSAEIKVVNKENDIEIIIKDNGKGFDVVKEKTSASKIGLKTLSERSKFLKANFKILSEINQGTTLIFNIPKYA